MEAVPVLAAAGVATASLLLVSAEQRLSLATGLLAALVLLPMVGGPLPTPASWTAATAAYLAATLIGAWLLWAGTRGSGSTLPIAGARRSPLWAVVVIAGLAIGLLVWPMAIGLLDPERFTEAGGSNWLDGSRWAAASGLALALGGIRLLLASDPARLPAGAAALSAAAWLLVVGSGANVADLALPAVGLVLPLAAAAALVSRPEPAQA